MRTGSEPVLLGRLEERAALDEQATREQVDDRECGASIRRAVRVPEPGRARTTDGLGRSAGRGQQQGVVLAVGGAGGVDEDLSVVVDGDRVCQLPA
jgi:hypothetical protein